MLSIVGVVCLSRTEKDKFWLFHTVFSLDNLLTGLPSLVGVIIAFAMLAGYCFVFPDCCRKSSENLFDFACVRYRSVVYTLGYCSGNFKSKSS